MKPTKVTLWRLALAGGLLILWEFGAGRLFDPFWFSQPSTIAAAAWKSAQTGQLWEDLSATFRATAIGYLGGAGLGLVLGVMLAQSETLADVLRPFMLALYGIPRIALAPIFVLWFGIALTSKVMMAGMMSFLLVFFSTYDGVRDADLELRNVARILGTNRWQLFWHVTIPNASPWIISPGCGSRFRRRSSRRLLPSSSPPRKASAIGSWRRRMCWIRPARWPACWC